MDFTTLDRVKTLLQAETNVNDAFLSQMISVVSAEFESERWMDRWIEQKTYTEKFDPDGLTQRFFLRAIPIVSITTVTDPNGDAVDADDFKFHDELGYVEFSYPIQPEVNGVMSIEYVGGVAAPVVNDVSALLASLPQLVFATELAVAQLFQARNQLGGITDLSMGGDGIKFMDPSALSKRVRQMLMGMRR